MITQFHKLSRLESSLDPHLARQLSAAYHFKEAADYATGPAGMISNADAQAAITTAEHFVAKIAALLSTSAPDNQP